MRNHQREFLLGLDKSELLSLGPRTSVHKSLIEPLNQLKEKAAEVGIELGVTGGYREFQAQLKVWNEKSLSPAYQSFTPTERVGELLNEIELPGLCRYHWGTDIDVYDRHVIMQGCHLKLAPGEVTRGGPFFVLDAWMEKHLSEFGFYRPFDGDIGGVFPRWWQISYRPTSEKCLLSHRMEWVAEQIHESEIKLKEEILNNLPSIFEKYLKTITIKE